LQVLIAQLGLQGRVMIEPPVPFDRLIAKANESDVGYCVVENYSAQRQFAAQNKFLNI
jgi:hypothetical protein